MSSVETEQVSAVETGQMSAAETGQMPAVETKQMSSVARTDISVASTHKVEVSEVSTVPMWKSQKSQLSQCSSLRSLNCPNVQASDRRSGPKSTKIGRNGSRMVARSSESVPVNPPAIFSPLGPVPRPKNLSKKSKKCLFGVSRWGYTAITVYYHDMPTPRQVGGGLNFSTAQ